MEQNEINNSNKTKLFILTLLVLLVSVAGISYAYFTIQITGNDTASSMRLRTANMSLVYNDVQIVSDEYIVPGWNDTKTLTVTNNGNMEVDYTIKFRELVNTISNGELVLSATCSASSGSCANLPERAVHSASTEITDAYMYGPISIAPGVTHTYTLTILFKETGSNQNYNQDKYFNGTLNIGDGTTTDEICFKYSVTNNEVAIKEYNGDTVTYNINQTTCENYLNSIVYEDPWEGTEYSPWTPEESEAYCAGTGLSVDACYGYTLEESLINGCILDTEYSNYGLSNVNIQRKECPLDVIIPSTINGKSVKTIGDSAFSTKSLTSVIIPNSVTSIGNLAFYSNSLSSIVIPNSVTTIGDGAFSYNQLTSVEIPSSLTVISNTLFNSNKLISVAIPNTVTTINDFAFLGNKLTSIVIPSSVTTVGQRAFGSNELTSIDIPRTITSLGKEVFQMNKITTIKIPDTLTAIPQGLFNNNKLTSIDIPSTVTSIGASAFASNLLTSIDIPSTVTSIGGGAFQNNKLTSIVIPSSITKIEDSTFSRNLLTSVELPNTITTIGSSAFETNKLSYIKIPSSVTKIEIQAFDGNNFESVRIEGKTSSSQFTTYRPNWKWKTGLSCITNNPSYNANGCVIWDQP